MGVCEEKGVADFGQRGQALDGARHVGVIVRAGKNKKIIRRKRYRAFFDTLVYTFYNKKEGGLLKKRCTFAVRNY
jgi:hypothetical protein